MDKLYMEYADYLTGVCARYISDEDEVKDVLQESFGPRGIVRGGQMPLPNQRQ